MKKAPLITSIKITKPIPILIIEHSDTGMDIKKGSHIYCGICGGTIGRATDEIELPVSHETFRSKLNAAKMTLFQKGENSAIMHSCGKLLFLGKPWVFISKQEYDRQIDSVVIDYNPKYSASTGVGE